MIEIATLLLAAAAMVLALAAFRRSATQPKESASSRDQGLRQDLSELKNAIDSLPGRIADETAASPLREAVEAVRESIERTASTFDQHAQRVGEGFSAGSASLEKAMERGLLAVAGLDKPLEAIRAATENAARQAQASDPARAFAGLDATLRELLAAGAEQSASRERAIGAGVHKIELSLLPVVDSLGRLGGRIDTLSEGSASARSEASEKVVLAVRELAQTVVASKESDGPTEGSTVLRGLESLSGELRAALSALPLRIAEASANHARPVPELEELAIAVRESGHLRGDASRSVADAVSRVSQELSESANQASQARAQTATALELAMSSMEAFATRLESRLAPLSDALKGHGDAVAPMAQGLATAQDRLEEAAASLRANQVEFAASVAVFTQAAQELSGGLSLFAREGDMQGSEDPKAVQKALLESLDRLMGGFAESLKALLTESDLRTREVLTEIAARLPAGEKA